MSRIYARSCIRLFLIFRGLFSVSAISASTSRFILVFSGLVLLNIGTFNLAQSQRDPEAARAGEPEGVCCLAFPEPVLFPPLPPEPVVAVLNPEEALGVAPEQAPIDPGQIAQLPAEDPEPLIADYDDSLPRFAAGNLLRFIEGSFGALVMIGSGLGAIIAGAFGAYKAALSLLFVAVGAFILRALVSLFFGTEFPAYNEGGMEFVGEL